LSQFVAYDPALESDGCRDSYQREAGMGLGSELEHADRFATYVNELTKVLGHADREKPFRDYCAGLLATEGRRSVEPMAVVTDPGRVSVQHQKLLHLVADSPWSDEKMLAKVREQVVPEMTRRGPIEVWIIDDTGFPKKGTHSVGVHHQYCGQLGKQANCQAAVTLSIANHHASLPIAYRLSICRASGLTIRPVVKRRMSQRRSGSRPSRRLRWSKSARRCWR